MAAGSIVIDLLLRTGSFVTDTRNAQQNWRNFERNIVSGANAIAGALGFAGLSLGGLAGGLGVWTKNMAQMGSELNRLSGIANSSTQEFQHWAYATKAAGIEQDKLADILKDVNDKTGEFLATGGGEMKDFFEQIAPKVGITAEQFRKLSGPQALQLYYDGLQKAGLGQKEITFYMEALANDATALAPLLADNGRELKRLAAEADALGMVMHDSTIAAASELQRHLDMLHSQFKGLSIHLANDALPMLNAVAKAFLYSNEKAGGLHVSLKDIARDQGFKTWLREIILMVATTADEIERLAGLVQGVAGSFKVVWADLQYGKAWADAKIVPPGITRRPEDQAIYDAILAGAEAHREKALKDSNAGFAKFAHGLGELSNYLRAKQALDDAEAAGAAISGANQKMAQEFHKTGVVISQGGDKVKKAVEDFSRGLRIKPGAEGHGKAQQGTYAVAQLLQQFAGSNLRWFSAFNDRYHAGRGKHGAGLAFDATFHNGQKGAADAIRYLKEVLGSLGFERGKDYRLLDEYTNPSKRATGGHLDFAWMNSGAAAEFAQLQKTGIAGNELKHYQKLESLLAKYIAQQQEAIALLGADTELAKLNAQIKLGAYDALTPKQQEELKHWAGLRDAAEEQQQQQRRYQELLEQATGAEAIKRHLQDVAMLKMAWEQGKISAEQYQLALGSLTVPEALKNPDDWLGGMNEGISRFIKNTGNLHDQVAGFTEATMTRVVDSLGALATGGKVAFRDMAASILSHLSRIFIHMAAMRLLGSIGSTFTGGTRVFDNLFADGGFVSGPGTGRSDSIPAMLSNGEFVINAQATARNRPLLEAINRNRFADGGYVGRQYPVLAGRGGPQNNIAITVNVDNNGQAEQTTQADGEAGRRLAQAIEAKVIEVITREQAYGGLLHG